MSRDQNIIQTADMLRTLIGTASSLVYKKDGFGGKRSGFEDERRHLVLDVMRIIEVTLKNRADWKQKEHFLLYNLDHNPRTYRASLTEYYRRKLDTDIRSFNRLMREGGYHIGGR